MLLERSEEVRVREEAIDVGANGELVESDWRWMLLEKVNCKDELRVVFGRSALVLWLAASLGL